MDSMEDVRELARKYALQNAVLHGGKASPGAVIGKVIAEAPELAREARELGKVVSGIVDDVNRLDVDEQRAELEMIAPELLRREKVEKTPVLPELKNVKGGVVMRLAPYPSGPLHIGNARAAVLNDEYVKKYGGKFLLVFDDTIGSDEKRLEKDAYQHIRDGLDWLGVDVHGVHYKSDRMPIYYEWGEKAVRKAVA